MSDAELRDELMTLLVAGHETTATELSWAFERLLRNPGALARLIDDIDSDGDEYVTATIRETLRRRPVLTIAGPRRVMSRDRDRRPHVRPRLPRDPEHLPRSPRPRDLPGPVRVPARAVPRTEPGTYTWIPFGGGRRRCVGASFALLEMGIVLRAVLSRMDVRAGSDGVLEAHRRRSITVVPEKGAQAVLTARSGRPAPTAA